MANEPIIEAQGLTKRFTVKKKTVEAVTDLTFQVARGELVAFLGPNGAGKSTSLRMLTTLIPPTAGTARVVGYDILRRPAEVRARIGYVGQLTSGSFAQRTRDELISQGAFYGMPRAAAQKRADELIESLDLTSFATRAVQQLSGGQKRRLDVALGLMHAPPLLFLDEPSTGLDPQSRANLWQHILDLRAQHGTTVFLTTHYLEEADRYAERVMVMDKGRVIADDTARAAQGRARRRRADARLRRRTRMPRARSRSCRDSPIATVQREDAASVTVTAPDGDALLPAAVRALDAQGITVVRATGVPPTLDDVFLALTGRTLREAGEGEPTRRRRRDDGCRMPRIRGIREDRSEPMTTTAATRPDTAVRANPARDTWNVLTRELKPVVRDPFTLIFSLVQPLVFLGLFAPLLIGSSGQPVGETLQWFVPGVLVMIVLFGTGATGSNLQYEMMTGSHERTLVAPLARSSLLVGRALKEIAPIVVQSLIIVLIAWPFGFTINVPGLVIGLALLAVFGVGLGSLSYTLALKTKDREWLFWGVQQTLIFPLLILSGMLLPLDEGPAWMQAVATVNPVNWVVQAERALFAGDLGSVTVLWGWVAALVLAALGLWAGVRAIRKSS